MTRFIIKKLPYDLSSHAGLALVGQYFKSINLNALVDPAFAARLQLAIDRAPAQKTAIGAFLLRFWMALWLQSGDIAWVIWKCPLSIELAALGSRIQEWVKNTNGTHDVGAMQFNTLYLGDLAKYGITAKDVSAAGCYSYDLAA